MANFYYLTIYYKTFYKSAFLKILLNLKIIWKMMKYILLITNIDKIDLYMISIKVNFYVYFIYYLVFYFNKEYFQK